MRRDHPGLVHPSVLPGTGLPPGGKAQVVRSDDTQGGGVVGGGEDQYTALSEGYVCSGHRL